MEPEVRFAQIEARLRETSERAQPSDRRFNERMDRAIRRIEKGEEASKRRMDRLDARAAESEKRMEKFDIRLEATRKLVEAGMKIVVRLVKSHRELEKSHKAFIDSLRKGGNGNGRKHGPRSN